MAITTQERTNIIKLTVGLFNAAPGANYLAEFTSVYEAGGHSLAALASTLNSNGTFTNLYPNFLTGKEFATKFLSTLNLQNNQEAMDYVVAKYNAGVPKTQIILDALVAIDATTSPAFAEAQALLVNKAAVAENYSVTLNASAESLDALQNAVANVTADPASVTAANAANAGASGQIFTLAKGLDNILGTAGNDTIIGSLGTAELTTLSALDLIDGGAGVDTLQVLTESAAIKLGAGIKNVEIVEARSAAALDVDSSAAIGVQTLKVIGAVGDAAAKAAATTDIAVKLDATTANAITTQGGKNVSVELANASTNGDTVTVGAGGVANAAKGDVTVSVTGKAQVAAATTTLGNIAVNGGKTISVTQKASSDASAAATSKAVNSVTQGNVAIAADASTTTVTVKQDAAVTGKVAQDTTGGVTETVSVKFGALKAADSVTVHGLTLTAKVDLTAAEVASAFANLVDGKVPTAGVDTQGSGLVSTKGIYSGTFAVSPGAADNWTTAAANADTVVFTATRPNVDAATLAISGATATGSVAPVPTVTNGKIHDATPAGGVLSVVAGKVEITGAAALKTVTVDGFATASFVNSATALETLNASNGSGTFAVGAAAETLNVNLNNFGVAAVAATLTAPAVGAAPATLDLNATTTKTLNVKVEGKGNAQLDLTDASAVAALNVSGTSSATVSASNAALTTVKVTESAGLTLATASATLTSVDTTGTTGTVSATIDGGKATYAGGAGVDNVTVGALTGATLSKSINLGAGNDKLDLTNAALTAAILKATPATAVLEGGEGTDTIVLTATNAVELSKDAVFAGKINGFEKLSLTAATVAGTVDLSNLDNINYVISANSNSVTAPGTNTTFSLTVAGTGTIGDTVAFGGKNYVLTSDATSASALATQLYALIGADLPAGWVLKSVGGAVLTFEANAAGATTAPANGSYTDTGAVDTPTFVVGSTILGTGTGTAAPALTIDKMASGGTLELTAAGAGAIVNVKDALTGTADVLNVVANAATGNLGTVKAAEVETINVSVANKTTTFTTVYGDVKVADAASVSTLALDANAAKVVNVTGAGDLKLNIAAATKVAAVDASTATGALTLDLSAHNGVAVTVTGGAGNDVLMASVGINAKADVLIGGAGADTLVAGSNGAKLTGGAGNDLFLLTTAGNKEANTYSSITDFQAGDVLQISGLSGTNQFGKLTATLNESTAEFSNFVNAAILQAGVNEAVWFQFNGNAYVVIDQAGGTAPLGNGTSFENGIDSIIELVGVDLANASFNSVSHTVALV